ncbi:hypothetical protein B0J13DRAFT_528354 [Dactylonectria estremocensis]|uniref:Uncharacterized protein n=1 Tax=Dactylonectria estremocensis TaxID=1079267 RepID=A0A9P9IZP7_9HYPO|nr:hypothetical protein B0J13DRAFT_528354 [Dactylonectria estremocensis]
MVVTRRLQKGAAMRTGARLGGAGTVGNLTLLPTGRFKTGTQQESPKDLMTDYWRRGSPPYGDRSSSSEEATCIDVTGPDDKDDLPPDLLSGGCGVDSLETAISTQLNFLYVYYLQHCLGAVRREMKRRKKLDPSERAREEEKTCSLYNDLREKLSPEIRRRAPEPLKRKAGSRDSFHLALLSRKSAGNC